MVRLTEEELLAKQPFEFEIYNEKGEVIRRMRHEGSDFDCKACEWEDCSVEASEKLNPEGKLDEIVCPKCSTKNYRHRGALVTFEEELDKAREWVYELLDMGISFDRDYGCGGMGWNLDWSLAGATPEKVIELTKKKGLKFEYNWYGWYSLEKDDPYDSEPLSEEERKKSFKMHIALDSLKDAWDKEGSEAVAREWDKMEENWHGGEQEDA